MNNSPLYLAIDQGGHASRALVFDDTGAMLCEAFTPIDTITPQPNWVEHDPKAMLDSIRSATADALQKLAPEQRQNIKAAGLATQRSSIMCWDRITGKALSPIISWQDTRNATWLDQFRDQQTDIHQRTGLMLSAHYGVSKMRWCLDHLSAVQQAKQQQRLIMGPMASYVIFQLTRSAQLVADPANASRTLLWNLVQQDWDEHLLTLFNIPLQCLPPCVSSDDNFGVLDIPELDIPLRLVTGDQSAALFGQGQPSTDSLYINMGTGVFMQRPGTGPTPSSNLLNSVAVTQNSHTDYTLEATINGGARALHWFAEQHGISNIEQALDTWLTEEQTPTRFINSVSGLASPYWRTDIAPHFIDPGTTQQQAIAVAESVLFLIKVNVDAMNELMPAPRRIIVSGGLALSARLCQKLADLLQTTITRNQQAEATACGLAFLLAHRPTNWSINQGESFEPDHNNQLISRYFEWKTKLEQVLTENKEAVTFCST